MPFSPPSPSDVIEESSFVPPSPSDIEEDSDIGYEQAKVPEPTTAEQAQLDEQFKEMEAESSKGPSVWQALNTPLKNISLNDLMSPGAGAVQDLILNKIASKGGKTGKAAEIVLGAKSGAGDLISGATSPLGIATIPLSVAKLPSAITKVAMAGLAVPMAAGVPESARQAGEATVSGTAEDATRKLFGLGANIAFPAMIGGGIAKPRPEAPILVVPPGMSKPPLLPELQRKAAQVGLIKSAQALRPNLEVEGRLRKMERDAKNIPPISREAVQLPEPKIGPFSLTDNPRLGMGPIPLSEPKVGPFIVDERGVAMRVPDPQNITAKDVATIKASPRLSEHAIALSAKIGEQHANTIFVDENGNAQIGPIGQSKGTPVNLSLQERIAMEAEADRQVNEALGLARAFALEQTKVTPKSIEKSLPERPGMTEAEKLQIATQFVERVPSEAQRGLTEFEGPGQPQVLSGRSREGVPPPATGPELRTAQQIGIERTGGPLLSPEPVPAKAAWEAALERWADGKIGESQKHSFTGIDPELFAAYTVKGALLLKNGLVNVAQWSVEMVKQFGDGVRPHLDMLFRKSHDFVWDEFKITPIATPQQIARPQGSTISAQPVVPTATPPPLPESAAVPAPGILKSVVEFFRQRQPETLPELVVDETNRLPLKQSYENEKAIAANPHGLSRIPIIGRFLDPRAGAKAPIDVGIITRARSVETGKTIGAVWAETQQKFGDLFKADKDGSIPLENGQRGYMSDVIEAEMARPGSQSLSPAQRQWINDEWLPIKREVDQMLRDEGVTKIEMEDGGFLEIDKPYFPRPAIAKRGIKNVLSNLSGTGGRPGSKPFFMKERLFPTEQSGVLSKEQLIYDPSHISRVAKFISSAYRAMADHRLANDATLGGRNISERYNSLKSKFSDERATLGRDELSEFDAQLREQAAHPLFLKEATVNVGPAFSGKIFPIEVARKIERFYGQQSHQWVRNAETVTGASKALMLTLDVSAPLTQGLGMMISNPVRWAKATGNSLRALADPKVMSKVLTSERGQRLSSEFVQAGGTISRLQDFLSGAGHGPIAENIPGVKRFGKSFGAFLDIAKLELWDAYSKGADKAQWPQLAETLENSLFSARMESIGLNPGRAVAERILALAPSYYRSAPSLVATAFTKGVSGHVARRMLVAHATGLIALTYAAWKAIGLSDEEIVSRLNPSSGKFMKVPLSLGGDSKTEVGLGNIVSSYVRLMGNAAKYLSSDKPIDGGGVEDNPFLKFMRSKAAFLPGFFNDLITGTDFMGNEIGATESVIRRMVPMVVTKLYPNQPAEWNQKFPDAALSFIGINSFPQSKNTQWAEQASVLSRERFKKDFSSTNLKERYEIVKSLSNDPRFNVDDTVENKQKIAVMALRHNAERQKSLTAKLSEESKKKLITIGETIPGYKLKLRINGQDVPLIGDEQKRYEDLLAKEYDVALKQIPLKTFLKASPESQDKMKAGFFVKARDRARAIIIQQLGKRSP